MKTEVLDQNGDVYFMLKNKSVFVYTKCLRFLNKSFQEYLSTNSPEEYLTESGIDF